MKADALIKKQKTAPVRELDKGAVFGLKINQNQSKKYLNCRILQKTKLILFKLTIVILRVI